MAYFKNIDELAQGIAESGQSWSDADKALAGKDIEYGNSIFTLKKDWQNAMKKGDTTAAQDIHDRTEDFRRKFGNYTGGADGSGYVKDTTYFNYDDPYKGTLDGLAEALVGYGKFENPYQKQTDRVLDSYLNRDPFEYDLGSDPNWQQYQKTYLREGQRAREDTLGNYAAATGGQASTAAVNAASQAQDYYNAQMADKIPELYKLAYDIWLNEGQQYAGQLDALRGLGADALNAWNANLGLLNNQFDAYKSLSDTGFDRAYTKWGSDYQVGRDSISDTRYEDETAYNRAQSEQQQALAQALEWMQLGVQPDSGVTSAAGLAPQDVDSYLAAVRAQQAAKGGSGGSGGSGTGDVNAPALTGGTTEAERYDALFRAAQASGNPNSYISEHYKDYGFDKSSGLTTDYKNWSELPASAQNVPRSNVTNQSGSTWVHVPGMGRVTWGELERYIDAGKVKESVGSDGKYRYTMVK
ncbi:MAG: hypothetical protein HFH27_04870 [Clostridiaceae bacterium]|nr:hypothetical protein [Clostridiaceae bacterium]